jgi:1-acyl-sn-glycerol-3-phosphate acyltransferase
MSLLRAVWRLLRLALHLGWGMARILILFPRYTPERREACIEAWARQMLAVFNIQVRVEGPLPEMAGRGALLVSNHVSWLDIHVLHSLLPVRFISKAEVRGWPVIGWLAEETGTVFLVREKKADALRVNQLMAEHIAAGDLLAFFPEGTTSDGRGLLPFYPSLFQPAVDAQAPIWPVHLSYRDLQGQYCEAAAYYNNLTLGQSLWRIAQLDGLRVTLRCMPAIAVAPDSSRKTLSQAAEAAIRGAQVEALGGMEMGSNR